MHRIAAQQGSALDDVAVPIAAHDDRTQTHTGAAGTVDEDAGEQTTDATEAVEHDVAGLALAGLRFDDLGELGGEEGVDIGVRIIELLDEAAQIDASRSQVETRQRLDDAVGDLDVELFAEEVASVAVSLDHAGHRLVQQRPSEQGQQNVVLTVQASD